MCVCFFELRPPLRLVSVFRETDDRKQRIGGIIITWKNRSRPVRKEPVLSATLTVTDNTRNISVKNQGLRDKKPANNGLIVFQYETVAT